MGEKKDPPYLIILTLTLLVKAALMLFVILYAVIGLGPDEAQYWTWSRQLDFGYYSKPPAIAWEIWAGTHLFGSTELGVRSGALTIGFLLPYAVYALGRAAALGRAGSFWAAQIMAWSPLGVMASFLAITDSGMVLFWTLALVWAARGLQDERPSSYYLLGIIIACGALFKWVMYEFWILIALLAAFVPRWRSWHILGGMVVSALGLLPSVLWSARHEWATFRHVGATIWSRQEVDVGTTELIKGNALEFLGAQAILLSPILFILLLFAGWYLWKKRDSVGPALLLCGCSSLGIAAVYLFVAAFKKMQGNWVDFAYPAGAVVIAWYAWEESKKLRVVLLAGLGLSVVLCAFALAIPSWQAEDSISIPYKFNPFRHNVGWNDLNFELKAAGYHEGNEFLFSDKYQTTSILCFYVEGQPHAYFFNLHGIRKNQFSFWPGMAQEQKGKNGFFVAVENVPLGDPKWKLLVEEYKRKLAPFFHEVRDLGVRPLFYANGAPVKGALIFKCIGYNGKEPEAVTLY